MKNVKLIKMIIPKSQIAALSDAKKKQLLMLMGMMRDLNLLQKMLLYIAQSKTSTEPEEDAKETTVAFFLKNLISKIYEMYIFFNNSGIKSDRINFSDELQKKRKAVDDFYKAKGVREIFSFIRNKFGFHYGYENDIDGLIAEAFEDEDFVMWLSPQNSTNEIFPSLDKISLKVIITEMRRLGFTENLFNTLLALSIEAANIFREFYVLYLSESFNLNPSKGQAMAINALTLNDVSLPLIIDNN